MIANVLACFLALSQAVTAPKTQDATPAPDPAKLAAIEEIFQLTKPDQMMQQMFSQMKAAVAEQAQKSLAAQVQASNDPSKYSQEVQKFTDQLLALMSDRLSWDKVKPQYVHLYDETFSLIELQGILEFYKSPAGQAMLQKMPMLLANASKIGQQQMSDIMPEVQKMMADFTANLKKSREANGSTPVPQR